MFLQYTFVLHPRIAFTLSTLNDCDRQPKRAENLIPVHLTVDPILMMFITISYLVCLIQYGHYYLPIFYCQVLFLTPESYRQCF